MTPAEIEATEEESKVGRMDLDPLQLRRRVGSRCRRERPHREKRPCACPTAHPAGHENAGWSRKPTRPDGPLAWNAGQSSRWGPPSRPAQRPSAGGGRCRSETGAPSRPRLPAGLHFTATGWRSACEAVVLSVILAGAVEAADGFLQCAGEGGVADGLEGGQGSLAVALGFGHQRAVVADCRHVEG